MFASLLAAISVDHAILVASVATMIAVAVLVVLAVRQSRQGRMATETVTEVRHACAHLSSRLDTVAAHCEAEFAGIKGRLSRVETVV